MVLPPSAALVAALALAGTLANAQAQPDSESLNTANTVNALSQADDPVVQVTAGGAHACALVQSGQVYCWGNNVLGEVGDGTTTNRGLRERVKRVGDVASISAGQAFTCASRNTC